MKRNMIMGIAILGSFILNFIISLGFYIELSNQYKKVATTTNVTEKYYVTKSELENWQSTGESQKIQDDAVELEPVQLENGDRIWEIKE